MADSAVIVNEFGEVGIDHALVETAFEDAVLMRSGCLCCTLRGDLVDTLCELGRRVDAGELPAFARVLVETTGLADPGPILRTLMSEPLLTERYRAGIVVATVDALHAAGQNETQAEFARQVAVADRVVVTKTDLASHAERDRTLELVRRMNPAALLLEVVSGAVEPADLLATPPHEADARTEGLARWAALGAGRSVDGTGHDAHRADVNAWCLYHDEPLEWAELSRWLTSVVSLRGDRLLRMKGLVNVAGESGTDRRACGAARHASSGQARALAGRRSTHAARVHHPLARSERSGKRAAGGLRRTRGSLTPELAPQCPMRFATMRGT